MAPKHASATAKPAWTLLCVDKRVLAEGSRGALRDAPVRPLKQRSRRSGSSAGFSAAPFRDTKFEWFDRPDSRGIVAATYRSSVILTVRSRQEHLARERVAYQYGADWLLCTGGPDTGQEAAGAFAQYITWPWITGIVTGDRLVRNRGNTASRYAPRIAEAAVL